MEFGCVASWDNRCVTGWAYLPGHPDHEVKVAIILDGKSIAIVDAGLQLPGNPSGNHNDRHGFCFILPKMVVQNKTALLQVINVDAGQVLPPGAIQINSSTGGVSSALEAVKQVLTKLSERYPKVARLAREHYFFKGKLGQLNRWFQYRYRLFMGIPYLGPMFSAMQMSSSRVQVMRELLRREASRNLEEPFNVLEIGSWAGSSAIMWARTLESISNPGKVFCIDAWREYESLMRSRLTGPMQAALRKDRIFKLFNHNVQSTGLGERIICLRATSDTVAPILATEFFDLVYLDGDHAYSQVKNDLDHYARCVKPGGILCGDDLEHHPFEIDLNFARMHLDKDMVTADEFPKDIKPGGGYHPGIVVAIQEYFGDVSMREGFWAMRKVEGGWQPIDL